MAEYEEMVASAADYESDDSGADTDEEVTNGTAIYVWKFNEKQDQFWYSFREDAVGLR